MLLFPQRFTNEDHLAVHKHKHEMTLRFGPARSDSVIIAGEYVKTLHLSINQFLQDFPILWSQRLMKKHAEAKEMTSDLFFLQFKKCRVISSQHAYS